MLTALYRHFDCDGVLLYVGISLSHITRLRQHRNSNWHDEITLITVEQFPTRGAAELAEMSAIMKEGPIYNKQHSIPRPHETITYSKRGLYLRLLNILKKLRENKKVDVIKLREYRTQLRLMRETDGRSDLYLDTVMSEIDGYFRKTLKEIVKSPINASDPFGSPTPVGKTPPSLSTRT